MILFGGEQHTAEVEVENEELYMVQRSLMVVQADHTTSEITAMESSAGTVLDIPPLRSYGGNRIQGFLIDSEHFEWVRQ